jgi:hypothetical protein
VEEIVKAVRRVLFVMFAVSASMLAVPPAGAQPEPSLRIVPTPTTAGQTVTAYGRGFCAAATCPPVAITVDGRTAAIAAVDSSGSFTANFTAPTIPNQYAVIAEQATNPPLRAAAGMLVVASDVSSSTSVPSPRGSSSTTSSPPANGPTQPGSDRTTTSTRSSATHAGSTSDDHDSGTIVLLSVAGLGVAAILGGFWLQRRRRN